MRRRRRQDSPLPLFCAAFGLGVLLALCGHLRLILILAALALICLGARCCRR